MATTTHRDEGARAHEALAHSGAHVTHAHEPGTMDVTAQERTFAGFMRLVTRMAMVIIVILLLLAIFRG